MSLSIQRWPTNLGPEVDEGYATDLHRFLEAERARRDTKIYRPPEQVYAALELTPYEDVRVLILGQDPYPNPGQAHGLAFSVPPEVTPPLSLWRIFEVLESDLGTPRPGHGCLEHWASEGVLLLNTTLTVRHGEAGSSEHRKAWMPVTDAILRLVSANPLPVVFMLWGREAQRKKVHITGQHHLIIESSHPAARGRAYTLKDSRPFSQANAFLSERGRGTINWSIPDAEATPDFCTPQATLAWGHFQPDHP